MERSELEKMNLQALRTLATERGVDGAAQMSRAQLIDALVPAEPAGVLKRAKDAVVHAAHRVEERAHAIAERLRDHGPEHEAGDAERAVHEAAAEKVERARAQRGWPQRAGFDIPSSTVHPHAEELETLTMAQLYLKDGQDERALEIFEKLLALDPEDAVLVGQVDELRKKVHKPAPPPPPPAPVSNEPLFMLDLEELPETYGLDECEVLYKDPFWAFAYWEVTDHGLNAARAQLGPSAGTSRLVLRLFTTVAAAQGVERQISDIDLTWNHGRRYFPAPRPGAHLRVAVGLLSAEGYFAPIAHSSLIRLPTAEPGPIGPVEWMEVLPNRTRGRERESLVIVRRGEHDERSLAGVPGAYGEGEWEEPVGASKGRWKPGDRGPGPNPTGSSSGGLK